MEEYLSGVGNCTGGVCCLRLVCEAKALAAFRGCFRWERHEATAADCEVHCDFEEIGPVAYDCEGIGLAA